MYRCPFMFGNAAAMYFREESFMIVRLFPVNFI